MADTKTSALPAASTPLADADLAYVVQSGNSRQTTVGDLVGTTTQAPTIIVGNVPAGDPATARTSPRYIPDIGDGAGIALALGELAASSDGGWLHVRCGTYDLGLGTSPALPLVVSGCRVTGDGDAPIIKMSATDRRVFQLTNSAPGVLGRAPELEDIRIEFVAATAGATGTAVVEQSAATRALIENVEVIKLTNPTDNAHESLTSIFLGTTAARFLNCRVVSADDNTAGTGVVGIRLSGPYSMARDCDVSGGGIGYLAESLAQIIGCSASGGVLFATHRGIVIASGATSSISGCTVASSNAGIVVESGGSATIAGNIAIGLNVGADAIRLEAGAVDCFAVANDLSGFAFNDLGTNTTTYVEAPGTPQAITIPFGAKFNDHGKLAIANGKSSDNDDTTKPKTRQPIPAAGTIERVAYVTDAGDATTQIKIHINGVVQATFLLGGAAGVETGLAVSVAAGDYVEIELDAGSDPNESTWLVVMEVS